MLERSMDVMLSAPSVAENSELLVDGTSTQARRAPVRVKGWCPARYISGVTMIEVLWKPAESVALVLLCSWGRAGL